MDTSFGSILTARSLRVRLSLLTILLACWMLPATAGYALRIPEAGPERRVQVHAFWNTEYLCLAARVPDTIITGTSNQPMSTPDQDDAIEFDFLLPTGEAHRLIISAAEGMTMLTRDAQGRWRSDNAWVRGPRTIKYAVALEGTRNAPQDVDTAFVVECAIPWEFLGGMPKRAVEQFGFNVINWMQGENEGLVSWSPYITSAADVGDVTHWGRLGITRSGALLSAQNLDFPCPFNPVALFVDGTLSAPEWLTSASLSVAKPDPQLQPAPVSASPTPSAASFQALMAIYRYDWEPDRFWKESAPATVDQPQEGVGPWYRYDRVDWHRNQLTEVKRAGIDVVLVHYQGDPESRRTWSRTGLDQLTQALKEIRADDHSYPLVGLYLDTAALAGTDLKSDQGKQLVFTMLQDFFQHVPPEFRAQLGARPEAGTRGGLPVLLGEPTGLADWDESFMTYVEERLGPITWLGSSAWQEKGVTRLYARLKLTEAGLSQDGTGEVRAFTISPGYCPPPGEQGEIRSRRDGRAYRTDWQRMVAAGPSLVLINSWNDFTRGTEIAPSRQWGHQYVDATRSERARLGYQQPRCLRLLQHSTPEVLLPGATYQVDFLIENDGTEDVVTGQRTTADYRLTRRSDGQVVSQAIGAQNLSVRAGEIKRTPVLIAAKDQAGKALPPGDYVFTLVVMRSRIAYLRSPLVARAAAELSVPFTVGAPPDYKGTVLLTTVPASLSNHSAAVVEIRVRNDGAATWKASEAKVASHLVFADTAPAAEGAPVALPRDVKPGEVVSVKLPLNVSGHAGDGALTWVLLPKGEAGDLVQSFRSEAVAVSSEAFACRLSPAAPPREVSAGSPVEVAVEVTNSGTLPWPADSALVSAAWYDWDGRQVLPAGRMALPEELAPQMKAQITVALTAPPVPGSYRLAWEVVRADDSRLHPYPAEAVTPVTVTGGAFRALDLTDLGNCIAITTDAYRSQGDFDGAGCSFPAEGLPPDQSGARNGFYPAGYYAPTEAHTVPFVYPSLDTGVGTAVACTGQTIALGENAHRVHLLAASVVGAQELAVSLQSADGTDLGPVTVTVPSWRSPSEGAPVGAYAPYVRTLNGDEAAPGYLYHLTLAPTTPGAAVVKVVLPAVPGIRILAITIEE